MGTFLGFLKMKISLCIALLPVLATLTTALVIDDSQWNTPQLQLSDGWNMLRPDQTEAIDLFQVDLMRPLLPMFFNRSISWTQKKDANFTVRFTGAAVTLVGAKGPSAAGYTVFLDGKALRTYDAALQRFMANQTLFERDRLDTNVEHSVVVVNSGGGVLYFDYANVTNASINAAQTSLSPAAATVKPAITPPVSLPPQNANGGITPAQLMQLLTPYKFKWNAAVYFVIVFAALMSLLVIGMILHHIHQGSKARSQAHQSFFSGDPSKQHAPKSKATSRLESLKRFRKSKLLSPVEVVAESSPTEMQRPSSSDDLLEWNRLPPPRLRPRDVEDDGSSLESGRRGNQMTLAEALMQDAKAAKAGGTEGTARRDMF